MKIEENNDYVNQYKLFDDKQIRDKFDVLGAYDCEDINKAKFICISQENVKEGSEAIRELLDTFFNKNTDIILIPGLKSGTSLDKNFYNSQNIKWLDPKSFKIVGWESEEFMQKLSTLISSAKKCLKHIQESKDKESITVLDVNPILECMTWNDHMIKINAGLNQGKETQPLSRSQFEQIIALARALWIIHINKQLAAGERSDVMIEQMSSYSDFEGHIYFFGNRFDRGPILSKLNSSFVILKPKKDNNSIESFENINELDEKKLNNGKKKSYFDIFKKISFKKEKNQSTLLTPLFLEIDNIKVECFKELRKFNDKLKQETLNNEEDEEIMKFKLENTEMFNAQNIGFSVDKFTKKLIGELSKDLN